MFVQMMFGAHVGVDGVATRSPTAGFLTADIFWQRVKNKIQNLGLRSDANPTWTGSVSTSMMAHQR